VGGVTPIEQRSRPAYEVPAPKVGKATPVTAAQNATRLIYFDETRASVGLEQIASTDTGRQVLRSVADVGHDGMAGNQRRLFLQLAGKVDSTNVIDLETDEMFPLLAEHLHPQQMLAIKGSVQSAQEIKPTSLRLSVGDGATRVYVERTYFLHLNQSYLTSSAITVVGIVRSVSRMELCAIAIFARR